MDMVQMHCHFTDMKCNYEVGKQFSVLQLFHCHHRRNWNKKLFFVSFLVFFWEILAQSKKRIHKKAKRLHCCVAACVIIATSARYLRTMHGAELLLLLPGPAYKCPQLVQNAIRHDMHMQCRPFAHSKMALRCGTKRQIKDHFTIEENWKRATRTDAVCVCCDRDCIWIER